MHTHAHTHIHSHTYMCTHTHSHICTNTCTCTHSHIHTPMRSFPPNNCLLGTRQQRLWNLSQSQGERSCVGPGMRQHSPLQNATRRTSSGGPSAHLLPCICSEFWAGLWGERGEASSHRPWSEPGICLGFATLEGFAAR